MKILLNEVKLYVFSFLTNSQIGKMRTVSGEICNLLENQKFWKDKINDEFYLPVPMDINCKQYYIKCYQQMQEECLRPLSIHLQKKRS